jgi:hypothetical protein
MMQSLIDNAAAVSGPLLTAALNTLVDEPKSLLGLPTLRGEFNKCLVYQQPAAEISDGSVTLYNAQKLGALLALCARAAIFAMRHVIPPCSTRLVSGTLRSGPDNTIQ